MPPSEPWAPAAPAGPLSLRDLVRHQEPRAGIPARVRMDYAVVEGIMCPACGVALEEGEVFIGGLREQAPASLTFRFREVEHRKQMLRTGELRAAARCRHCGGIWVAPRARPAHAAE